VLRFLEQGEPLFPADTEVVLLARLFKMLGAPTPQLWPDFNTLWPGFSGVTGTPLPPPPPSIRYDRAPRAVS
jgi:hypothetical protein